MIKCHLSRLMGERKLKIADLARETGLHRNTITLLYAETASRVDLDAIDRLCGYFGVTVGALFEQVAPLPDLSEALAATSFRGTEVATGSAGPTPTTTTSSTTSGKAGKRDAQQESQRPK